MIEAYIFFSSRLKIVLINFIIGIFILAISLFFIQKEVSYSFDKSVYGTTLGINERMEHFADVLYSFRGLYYTHKEVSEAIWNIYNKSFNEHVRYSFSSETSFIKYVKDSDIKDRSKYSNLSNHDEHFIVHFHYGHDDGESAIGLDLSLDQDRYEALTKARDTGEIVSIPPLELFGKKNTIGVVLYLPIYDLTNELETVQDRRESLLGFMAYIIPSKDFVGEVFDPLNLGTLKIKITDNVTGISAYQNIDSIENSFTSISKKIEMKFGGRDWTIEYYDDLLNYIRSTQVLIFGIGSIVTINGFIHLMVYFKLKKRNEKYVGNI